MDYVNESREFAGISGALFHALENTIGELDDSIRNMSLLPNDVMRAEVAESTIGEENISVPRFRLPRWDWFGVLRAD